MIVQNVLQGTPEWDALRADHFTASEAPVIMGESPYMTRQDLIRYKAGICEPEEVSRFKQALFDKGHKVEAMARDITEGQLGEDLYPITATESVEGLPLLASYDGMNEAETLSFEHKLINEQLRGLAKPEDLKPLHYWQLEHQQLVQPCDSLFVASDGTEDDRVEVTYKSIPERRAELIAAWKQFQADLEAFKKNPKAEPKEKPQGQQAAAFPALIVEITGEVRSTNMEAYKAAALQQIASIKTELSTDQDFADAEVMVKALKSAEGDIENGKRQALAQTIEINELFDMMDEVKEAARQARLSLEKSVKAEKSRVRMDIANARKQEFAEHVANLKQSINGVLVHFPSIDPLEAMKGKKTIKSLEDAADQTLADAKLEANALADLVRANLTFAEEHAADYPFLFSDMPSLVVKGADDFQATVKLRIAEHKEAERAKEERMRAEAEAKAKAELKAKSEQPAPVEQPKKPAPTITTPAAPNRPADWQIIEAVAKHFGTTNQTAVYWIGELDMAALEAAA